MNLHQNKELFKEVINAVSEYSGLKGSIIEKDYYVSLLLERIKMNYPQIVFKGGTSLSKCYHLINRFSEDIDLNFQQDVEKTRAEKRRLKQAIIGSANEIGMCLKNEAELKSRRDFNRYQIVYPSVTESDLQKVIYVETYVLLESFPTNEMQVTNYILDYLTEKHQGVFIEKYEMNVFRIQVQSIERTFIDKLFALCDYAIDGKYMRNSRHLYDLHMIYTAYKDRLTSDKIKPLFKQVAKERIKSNHAYSAMKGFKLLEACRTITNEDHFKADYEGTSNVQLFLPGESTISYWTVKNTFNEVILSGIIPVVIDFLRPHTRDFSHE
ncbi:nucleotidyl transferase AbiEii/AbiGii toxin family protein [Sporolactobacillus sp. STCC-11]|uniref:nucleotidyl transferase AbiEii/AbiGii toxin family protein n=1 Tax=Sporolactobacillus caesalpiniae TaxID=3230362 RepID=UPI003392780A